MDSSSEFADRIRAMIQRESELINHRMTWFLTSQTILLGGLSVVWEKDMRVSVLFAVIGFVVCVSAQVSTRAAIRATRGLEQCWLDKCKELAIDPRTEPPVNGLYNTQIQRIEKLLFPWRLLPCFLALVWIILGILSQT